MILPEMNRNGLVSVMLKEEQKLLRRLKIGGIHDSRSGYVSNFNGYCFEWGLYYLPVG